MEEGWVPKGGSARQDQEEAAGAGQASPQTPSALSRPGLGFGEAGTRRSRPPLRALPEGGAFPAGLFEGV